MTRARDIASGIVIGTTANRPAGFQGQLYFDTTLDNLYQKNGYSWVVAGVSSQFPIEYVVVAGGGGAPGYNSAGGGGAGGYRSSVFGEMSGGGATAESKLFLNATTTFTVTVGAGGNGAYGLTVPPLVTSGSNSVFSTITSTGGGAGGCAQEVAPYALSGGSGGGSRGAGTPGTDLAATGGAGTPNQGFKGGDSGNPFYDNKYPGGGGGGAGAAAANVSTSTTATAGGVGVSSSITGSAVFRAGGGGGSAQGGGTSGAGGNGGGGAAGSGAAGSFAGTNGTANTGGGGGAGNTATGGNGGSGVVILRYPDSYPALTTIAAGLTYTTATTGGYKVYTFTAGTGMVTI